MCALTPSDRPFEREVQKGAALLDQHRPGWERGIDPSSLVIYHIERCILGQLYGDYGDGKDALLGEGWEMIVSWEVSAAHGFTVSPGREYLWNPEWLALRDAWLALLAERGRE